jgi:cytochrome P450
MIQAHRDEEHNRLRKSLAVSFSDKSMKEMEPRVKGWVQLFQTKLAERGSAEVDMVELFRCAVSLTVPQMVKGELGVHRLNVMFGD